MMRKITLSTAPSPFPNDASGATALEYAFIAMLVALVIIGGLTAIGVDLGAIFTSVSDGMDSAAK